MTFRPASAAGAAGIGTAGWPCIVGMLGQRRAGRIPSTDPGHGALILSKTRWVGFRLTRDASPAIAIERNPSEGGEAHSVH